MMTQMVDKSYHSGKQIFYVSRNVNSIIIEVLLFMILYVKLVLSSSVHHTAYQTEAFEQVDAKLLAPLKILGAVIKIYIFCFWFTILINQTFFKNLFNFTTPQNHRLQALRSGEDRQGASAALSFSVRIEILPLPLVLEAIPLSTVASMLIPGWQGLDALLERESHWRQVSNIHTINTKIMCLS